jgi:hypothetical protein
LVSGINQFETTKFEIAKICFMRRLPVVIFILVCGFISCIQPVKGRNGVAYKSPVQYNEYIINRQKKLMKNVLDFAKASQINLDSAGIMLEKYTGEIAITIEEFKDMPAYRGDTSLRDAAVGLFGFYKNVFQNDYSRIIAIRKKGEEMMVEDQDEMKKIVEKITREEQGFDKSFRDAQKNFADKNNLDLKENEMQKRIDQEIKQ